MHCQVAILICIMSFTALASGQGWTQIYGKLTHVSSSLNYAWGVNSAHDIYMCQRPCTGRNWERVPGKLEQVDVDELEVWGVD